MGKGRKLSLKKAKENLGKAMEEGDPKKIAAAAARVMLADPMSNNVFCTASLFYRCFLNWLRTSDMSPTLTMSSGR